MEALNCERGAVKICSTVVKIDLQASITNIADRLLDLSTLLES